MDTASQRLALADALVELCTEKHPRRNETSGQLHGTHATAASIDGQDQDENTRRYSIHSDDASGNEVQKETLSPPPPRSVIGSSSSTVESPLPGPEVVSRSPESSHKVVTRHHGFPHGHPQFSGITIRNPQQPNDAGAMESASAHDDDKQDVGPDVHPTTSPVSELKASDPTLKDSNDIDNTAIGRLPSITGTAISTSEMRIFPDSDCGEPGVSIAQHACESSYITEQTGPLLPKVDCSRAPKTKRSPSPENAGDSRPEVRPVGKR